MFPFLQSPARSHRRSKEILICLRGEEFSSLALSSFFQMRLQGHWAELRRNIQAPVISRGNRSVWVVERRKLFLAQLFEENIPIEGLTFLFIFLPFSLFGGSPALDRSGRAPLLNCHHLGKNQWPHYVTRTFKEPSHTAHTHTEWQFVLEKRNLPNLLNVRIRTRGIL